jgi:hypothetical protein
LHCLKHREENVLVKLAKNDVDFVSKSHGMQFQYRPMEALSSIYPQSVPDMTNTTLTILGSHFVDSLLLSVRISGPLHYHDFSCRWVSQGSLQCPVHYLDQLQSQNLHVRISNNGADFSTTFAALTIFPQVEVREAEPLHGPVAGGTEIVVVVSGLPSDAGSLCCRFDHSVVPATRISEASLSCVTPPHISGGVLIEVSTDGNFFFGNPEGIFTFNPRPAIVTMEPLSGPVSGRTSVTIHGRNINADPDQILCYFGDESGGIVPQILSDTSIECTTPPSGFPLAVPASKLVRVGISTNGGCRCMH